MNHLRGPSGALTAVRLELPLTASCEVCGLIFCSLVVCRLPCGAPPSCEEWADPSLVARRADPSSPADVNEEVLAIDARLFTAAMVFSVAAAAETCKLQRCFRNASLPVAGEAGLELQSLAPSMHHVSGTI